MNYFIKQIGKKDCAIACLKMLLAIVYRSKKFLYYPQPSKDQAYSLKDIIKFARNEGVVLEGYKYTKKESLFIKSNEPVLAVINNNNTLHMVLIKKIRANKLYLYDPKNGIYRIKKSEFIKIWNGEILEVKKIQGSSYKGRCYSPIKLKYRILSYFLQLSSMFFVLTAMFFIKEDYPFYVPLALFTCFAITELVYKRILIVCMKRFDNSMVEKIFYGNAETFKDKYIEMNKFKVLFIGMPIQIINSLVVLVAGMIILGINGYLNVINILGVISIRLILDVIEMKLFKSRSKNIEYKENELLETNDQLTFAKRMIDVQNNAYRQASFINFKKYFIAFVTGIICLFYAGFNGQISLNFILFHLLLYIYISENASKLLELYFKSSDYRQSKCLYKFYCNETQ